MNAVRKIDHHKELISNVRVALALALLARIPSREVKLKVYKEFQPSCGFFPHQHVLSLLINLMKKRRIILHPADATEESGGLLPTDVGDFALGSENSWLLGQPKCDPQPGQGL